MGYGLFRMDCEAYPMSNDTGLVYDRATDTYTELFWVNGAWTLKDGTVYRTVPLQDPNNIADSSANRKED